MGDTNRRTLFCFDHSNKRELALFTVWCGTACHLGLLKVNFKRHPPSGQTNYKKYLPPHPSGRHRPQDWPPPTQMASCRESPCGHSHFQDARSREADALSFQAHLAQPFTQHTDYTTVHQPLAPSSSVVPNKYLWNVFGRRPWHPTPVVLPGESHGQRSLVGCSPWGRWDLDTTERLHFHFSFYALEKEMATHSSVLGWRIPGTGEPGRLPSMGSHRVGHDWSDLAAVVVKRVWQKTAKFCKAVKK